MPVRASTLVLSLFTAAALLSPGAATAQTLTHICPIYPYMLHGTYTSYYALPRFDMAPCCGSAQSYQGANGLVARCNNTDPDDDDGCVPIVTIVAAKTAAGAEAEEKKVFTDLPGVDAPHKAVLRPGASIIGNGVGIIQFKKTVGATTKLLKAQVYHVRLRPRDFEPDPIDHDPVKFFIGHEVSGAAIVADRVHKEIPSESEVETLDDSQPNSAVVKVRIKADPEEWQTYDIVLRKPAM
jgi:hypothetical protein